MSERTRPQPVIGVVGWKDNGKTTLVCRLVDHLTARGFTVSTVKHAHHGVDPDQPGKDSRRHRDAGAREVMLATASRFVLFHEHAARTSRRSTRCWRGWRPRTW